MTHDSNEETFLTVPELAQRWRLTVVSIRRYLASGLIPHVRIGDVIRIAMS